MSLLLVVVVVVSAYAYFTFLRKNKRIIQFSDSLPGPKAWPILGSSLEFISDSVGIFAKMTYFSEKYPRFYKLWNNGKFFMISANSDDVEVLLGDNTNITKSDIYKFIIPWIGYGLLTSTGTKWKIHRRIITPTFFFKVLEDFLVVFNKNAKIMCESLEVELKKGTFNIFPYVNRAALDNICESAMGVDFSVQKNQDSTYLLAIKDICGTACLRLFKVWLMPDMLFHLTPYYKTQDKAIKYIHNHTINLIKQKREAMESKKITKIEDADDDGFTKKKTAFLDLLLEYAGSQLTDEEILDEVNTFMFEGHDTVSSALSFALYELARNPDVQERLYDEQMRIVGDVDSPLTNRHLTEMRYLDKVVKETLRLYPSVAFAGRELEQDLTFKDGIVVPKGTNFFINFYSLHRDPKIWKNPKKFDPENFTDAEGRHPFAFIPFSAGSRNCIGQKFAMMEMKVALSFVCRQYKLVASTKPEHELKLAVELVLISKTGINIKLEKR